jgi:hypothetical protein
MGFLRSIFLFASLTAARADYLDDTGYRLLAAELGAALPTGAGVGVSQIEYGNPNYLPQAGTGTFAGSGAFFAGKSFTAKSGTASASGHSEAVGLHFFSLNTNPLAGRATFTPGITSIDVYRVDDTGTASSWLQETWLQPGVQTAPLSETRSVQSHAWVGTNDPAYAEDDNISLRRFDYAIQRDGFLAVCGVDNGAGTAVPSLMSSAFNILSVGVSSGAHSSGGVLSYIDGPGRQKPEIVVPLDYTSFGTGLVSSAGALLRQTANSQGANARRPETLKAILLAGATKEEFPAWSHTSALPLDALFGAGELNVRNSWRILAGLEQSANQAAARPDFAWGHTALTGAGTADYLVRIPPGSTGDVFSAMAAWNRVVTDSNPGAPFVMAVTALDNYQLSLARVPVAGSPVVLEQSLSAIENVEHIYRRNLPSGTYRLRLSLVGTSSSAPAAVAWRLTTSPHRPAIQLARSGSLDTLSLTGLLPGQAYVIQSTTGLATWAAEQSFTATGTTFSAGFTSTVGRRFYRLAATD